MWSEKVKKSIFISTIGLILLSVIAKVASFLVRIQLARGIQIEAMSYYSLVSPTMLILISIAQLGIPTAISKVMAQNDQYQKPLFSALLFTICNTLLTVILFVILIPFIAVFFYHDIQINQMCIRDRPNRCHSFADHRNILLIHHLSLIHI